MAALIRGFRKQFNQGVIEDAQLITEYSNESEKMNPAWPVWVYEGVRVYRDEVSKFEYLRTKGKWPKKDR
jgi:hypothetical protein